MIKRGTKVHSSIIGIYLIVSLCLFLILANPALSQIPRIRVLIYESSGSVSISSMGKIGITDGGGVLFSPFNTNEFEPLSITPLPSGITINGDQTKLKRLIITPEDDMPIKVGHISYRGEMLIYLNNQNRLDVVNRLALDEYIKGLMKAEISPLWSYESLKSQAIVARTYSLYQMEAKSDNGNYDLKATNQSQVYKGIAGEDPISNRAVDETKGLVLFTKAGVYLPALYHDCCGGHTEDAKLVFYDYPDLIGVPCNYCSGSPRFEWEIKEDAIKLRNIFLKESYHMGPIINIHPTEITPSGRVETLQITHNLGKDIINGKQLRALIGNDILLSTLFIIKKAQDQYIFNGHGWGHGVGLCQWGAKGMAESGFNYKEILTHYYPLATVKQAY